MQLNVIFEEQRKLMEKYATIEVDVSTHDVPVDINTREGQARLRQFAWFYIEEIGEAIDARKSPTFHEELIDALHFMTEFAILTGLTPEDVTPVWADPAPTSQLLTLRSDWDSRAINAVHGMAHAINLLKAKPWKQNWRPTDLHNFRIRTISAYHRMLELLHYSGIHMDDITDLYLGKNKTNHERIANAY